MNQVHTPHKKKSGCLGCLGIGCLVSIILVVGLVVGGTWFTLNKFKNMEFVQFITGNDENTSIVEFINTLRNDIEVTEMDRYAGKYTFRNKKTGDWVTIDRDKVIVNGKEYKFDNTGKLKGFDTNKLLKQFGVEDNAKKIITRENIPEWVPLYPSGLIDSTIDLSKGDLRKGSVEMTAKANTDSVYSYFSKQMVEDGFSVKPEKKTFNETTWLEIIATNEKTSQKLKITVKESGNETKITIDFEEMG